MRSTRRHLASLLAVGILTVSAVVSAQESRPLTTTPPPPPGSQLFSDGDLDRLYRDLYGVQMQLGRGADVDSLRALREELLAEIRRLNREVEARRPQLEGQTADEAAWEESFEVFVEDIEDAAVDQDWERLAEVVSEQSELWGEGLEALGQQLGALAEGLEGLQVEIDADRIRIETDTGSRVGFAFPEEVKEDIRRGISEMGRELRIVLDDSSRARWGREIEGFIAEMPEGAGRRFFDRREREKTIIPESIYKFREELLVDRDEIVQGDVLVIGADCVVEGEVDGNVYVVGGDLFVEGEGSVAHDAVSLGGRVRVDEDSHVHGRRIAPNLAAPGVLPGLWSSSGGIAWLLHWSRVAMLALLVVIGFHVVEGRMRRLVRHGDEHAGRDLVSGALWFAVILGVFVVASVGLVISVIGIPIVVVLVAGLGIVALLAYAVGCHVVGERLLERFGQGDTTRTWQAALLGLAVLELPALVALAFSGADPGSGAVLGLRVVDVLLKFAVLALGFGAIIATRGGLEAEAIDTPDPAPALVLPAAVGDRD